MTATEAQQSGFILVVDDSEGTRFVFANWLRRAGYQVHEATSGGEAIEALSRFRFDLALLDVNLPDMSGFDICERIKTGRATSSIPVLHVSATATDPQNRSEGLNRGADGYLTEPVEREELLSTVAALLRYHEARRTSERLAGRLEQLHQTTLLINAASSLDELIGFAATGASSVFGSPAVLVATRGGVGWIARAAPNDLEAAMERCPVPVVLEIARTAGDEIDLSALPELAPSENEARSVPITTPRGELVGAIVLLPAGAELADDALLLDHFAQALAVAIENQRIYAVEHQIALTLQHAMLPQSIPEPEGLEVAVRYHAASDTVEIGGDFYEVTVLDRHRTLLAIGDVVGHSLVAATVMAELRYTLRAFAELGLDAGAIIERLNDLLLRSHPLFSATLCIAVVDTARDEVQITNAGHVPPLVYSAGHPLFIDEHGPLLGIRIAVPTPTVTVAFGPGTLLVLTTDGLVERRSEDLEIGLERLAKTVAAFEGKLEDLNGWLLQEVGSAGQTIDDVAILTARRPA